MVPDMCVKFGLMYDFGSQDTGVKGGQKRSLSTVSRKV